MRSDLAEFATLIYEELDPDADRFTDPLAYVFLAPPREGNDELRMVVLVQFKTYPMGDNDHFEANGLQRGTRIYQFGDAVHNLKWFLSFVPMLLLFWMLTLGRELRQIAQRLTEMSAEPLGSSAGRVSKFS